MVKGASIYDVRAKGGRGVSEKEDEVREPSKGGCVNLRTRGEGVKRPKKSENFADVICTCPLGSAQLRLSRARVLSDPATTFSFVHSTYEANCT